MKAKYINQFSVSLMDTETKMKELNAAYKKQLYENGIEDSVINRLKKKETDGIITEDESIMLSTRQSIDEFYNSQKEDIDAYNKEFVEADTSGVDELDEFQFTYKVDGDKVIQSYKIVGKSRYKVRLKKESIEKLLADSDYKIAKLYEAQVLGEDAPYDATEIISQRQEWRKQINELQKLLES